MTDQADYVTIHQFLVLAAERGCDRLCYRTVIKWCTRGHVPFYRADRSGLGGSPAYMLDPQAALFYMRQDKRRAAEEIKAVAPDGARRRGLLLADALTTAQLRAARLKREARNVAIREQATQNAYIVLIRGKP